MQDTSNQRTVMNYHYYSHYQMQQRILRTEYHNSLNLYYQYNTTEKIR